MPYELRGKCVYKQGANKPLKCYDNHKDALAYLRALEANVNDAKTEHEKAWDGQFISQREAQYVPLSATPGQACANCRWFNAAYDRCMIVESYPQPIMATGHSNRWEATPQIVEPDVAPIPVVIVEPEFDFEDSAEMSLSVPKGLVEQVKELIAKLRPPTLKKDEAFKVFKTANGRNAWISRHTGKWIDREKEILTDAAHDAYVTRVQKGLVDPPELWMWHAKGTRHGQAVTVWKAGGFVMAAGYFDDSAVGQRAFEYYRKHAGKIKLSHMFHYPSITKIDGVYHEYNTIEITTLPDGAEAFPYTNFEEIPTMPLPEAARAMISDALGEDVLKQAETLNDKALQDTKTLDGQGIASKHYDQYEGSPLVDAAQKIVALEQSAAAVEIRLKAAEEAAKGVPDLLTAVTAMDTTIKRLTEQLEANQKALTDQLEKSNALELKLAEFSDLKPPASQSNDTLLGQREKSLLDKLVTQAKSDSDLSLIEKLVGATPTVSST